MAEEPYIDLITGKPVEQWVADAMARPSKRAMAEVTQADLLPCPFCGNSARKTVHPRDERFGYVGIHVVECSVCTGRVTAEDPKDANGWANGSGADAAIAVWNNRPRTEAGDHEAILIMVETALPFTDEDGPPIWRVLVGGNWADFDDEEPARTFAATINALAARHRTEAVKPLAEALSALVAVIDENGIFDENYPRVIEAARAVLREVKL